MTSSGQLGGWLNSFVSLISLQKLSSSYPALGSALNTISFEMVHRNSFAMDNCIIAGPGLKFEVFEKLLKTIKESIESVSLREWMIPHWIYVVEEARMRAKFQEAARIIVDCCPNVRTLDIDAGERSNYFDAGINVLLSHYGRQLRELYMSQTENESIPCLASVASTCTSLRSFEFDGFSTGPIEALLPSIGMTLKEVELVFPYGPQVRWGGVLRALHDHCDGLESILLDDLLEDHEESEWVYAKFLMSYGKQLKSAYALTLGAERCEAVSAVCVNLS